jgi:hypothetical protein
LEALEALLVERGVPREDLKLVKEAKRRRRGGFERCFVVESVAGGTPVEAVPAEAAEETLPAWPGQRMAATPPQAAMVPQPAAPSPSSGRSELWNLGPAGRREAIRPTVEDPDRIEPAVRDL